MFLWFSSVSWKKCFCSRSAIQWHFPGNCPQSPLHSNADKASLSTPVNQGYSTHNVLSGGAWHTARVGKMKNAFNIQVWKTCVDDINLQIGFRWENNFATDLYVYVGCESNVNMHSGPRCWTELRASVGLPSAIDLLVSNLQGRGRCRARSSLHIVA